MSSFKCPKCKSTNVQVIGEKRNGFSLGKAAAGALLTPIGVGVLAGFIGSKGKYDILCLDCANRFKKK